MFRNLPFTFALIGTMLFFAGKACQADRRSTLLGKEQQLRQSLDTLRKTINAYTYDKRKAPDSLEDLVAAGYLEGIPEDPITGRVDWRMVGHDVHSASRETSSEGTPYNTW